MDGIHVCLCLGLCVFMSLIDHTESKNDLDRVRFSPFCLPFYSFDDMFSVTVRLYSCSIVFHLYFSSYFQMIIMTHYTRTHAHTHVEGEGERESLGSMYIMYFVRYGPCSSSPNVKIYSIKFQHTENLYSISTNPPANFNRTYTLNYRAYFVSVPFSVCVLFFFILSFIPHILCGSAEECIRHLICISLLRCKLKIFQALILQLKRIHLCCAHFLISFDMNITFII